MGDIQLITDGEGLAVIGEPSAVERFLHGLPSVDLDLPRLSKVTGTGAAVAQASSTAMESSGRWVKLTEESARLIKEHGLRTDSKTGLSTGVVNGSKGKGQIGGFVKFAKAPGSVVANPALLAGAAGIMAQAAMRQSMNEITDYLATIDEKLDDVLRAQEDSVWADLIGAGFDIDEALTIRDHGGNVNEVTWSKVQSTSGTLARTQAYALRQLDACTEKLSEASRVGDLAKSSREAQAKAQGWLTVLARCHQLQDAVAVLELDRVLETSPDALDGHRRGLQASRRKRREVIAASTQALQERLDAAASRANAKVLFHPSNSPAVVEAREQVATALAQFHERLGIESELDELVARRWMGAAAEVKDRMLEAGAVRVESTRRRGGEVMGRAKAAGSRVSGGVSEIAQRRRKAGSVEETSDGSASQD